MRELSSIETSDVSGAGLASDIGKAVGAVVAAMVDVFNSDALETANDTYVANDDGSWPDD